MAEGIHFNLNIFVDLNQRFLDRVVDLDTFLGLSLALRCLAGLGVCATMTSVFAYSGTFFPDAVGPVYVCATKSQII